MKKFFSILKRVIIGLWLAHLLYTVILLFANPPVTCTMLVSLMKGEGLTRTYVPIEQINPNARLAVLAAEDQLFATHHGFDLKGIQAAMEFNENQTGKIRGASTISQQVAKNVFLWQGRSWLRKGLEGYCTVIMELIYSKKRILELYLNVAEMGTGIYGIEAAAQHYFRKKAANLTKEESAAIAAILPGPKMYKANPPSPYVSRRKKWILKQMKNLQSDKEIQKLLQDQVKYD
jgi:monofunctional glycosyltransferase